MKLKRILIADDDSTIRRLLRRLLEGHDEWQVCGEASTGADAVEKAKQLTPDLVVLDLAMPAMNGLEAAEEIGKKSPNTPLLLVSVQQVSPQLVDAARKVGFSGAVPKSSGAAVVHGVEALLRKEKYFAVENTLVA